MTPSDPATILLNPAGLIIGWSDAAERLFGYTTAEIVGRAGAVLHEGSAESAGAPISEDSYRTKDGRRLRLIRRRTLVRDGSGSVLAYCDALALGAPSARTQDDAREEGEPPNGQQGSVDTLLADRARLTSIVESSPGVVISFRLGPDGRANFFFVSAAAAEILGFPPDAIARDSDLIRTRIPPDELARAQLSHREAARTGEPWSVEVRYLHPSGEMKQLEGRFRPARELDGTITWNGIALDATARKRAEEKLALVQAQLENALATTGMGAWMFDLENGKVWGNETTRTLWEVPADAPEWYDPQAARAIIHPEDRERVVASRERIVESAGLHEYEFRMVRSDGSVRWIAMRTRLERGDSRAQRLVGIEQDVTEQKIAAEAAMRSSKLEALGTLAGGVAHDFNNVLFAITGNAALTLGALPGEHPARSFVKEIAAAAARATELVRQILAFSRPEEQERVVLDMTSAVTRALSLVRATTPAMVAIASSFDPATPPIVGSASRVEQIVVNLCTNAVHAIGRGRAGHIEVRVEPMTVDEGEAGAAGLPAGRFVMLAVSDDGCGMDEYTKSRIFDPFFTTRAPGEGSGLGLSVVHGLVQALGGHIAVASRPEVGTTFRIYFPAAPQSEQAKRPEAEAAGAGQRILFVDDEPMLVALAESMLSVLGYEPAAFQDPQRALAAFREAPQDFAAVITDLSMPGMSGFDLARALLTIRKDLPILVMSGYVGADERDFAEQLGVRDLVLKPVTMERLRELLAQLCPDTVLTAKA